MQNPAKVMLADDQTMSREGLAELLASRGSIDVVILHVESPLGKAEDTLSSTWSSPSSPPSPGTSARPSWSYYWG